MGNRTFKFKKLSETHLPLLKEWLDNRYLQKWWKTEEISIEKVRAKYLPRIMGNDCARPYIVYLNEDPFGYIQYYKASDGDPNWWPDEPGQDVLGIDQFIADENSWGKGLGTEMITQFILYLTNNIKVSEIRVDPRPDNLRAICCYEKIGFRKIKNIVTPDGPAIMMTLEKYSFPSKKQDS